MELRKIIWTAKDVQVLPHKVKKCRKNKTHIAFR